MGEIIFLLLLAGVGVVYLVQTGSYRTPLLDNSGGPALFPRIVCIALIALIVIRIIQIIAQKGMKNKFKFLELFKGYTGFFSIATIVLILVIQYLGFIVSCFLYLTVVANGLYYFKNGSVGTVKSIILREILFLAFVMGLYLFFTRILFVAFPQGILSGLNL